MEYKIDNIFVNNIKTVKKCNFLIAVSGGIDSMVLLDLFYKNNLNFAIAHCNFKLRGNESNKDEIFVLRWAKKHNIKCFISKFNTKVFCKKNKFGIQEGARILRYDWFNELKLIYNFDYIVTAHNLDDQIETFLINSMRGSGLNSLTGITQKTNKLFRPIIDILKDDIMKYSKNNEIKHREDSSNLSNDYFRNMIRNSIIPKFKTYDDNVMLKFKTTMNNLNSTKIFVDTVLTSVKAKLFIDKNNLIKIEIKELIKLNPLNFYIHNLFIDYGFNFKEVIKLFKSDSGKYIESSQYKLTKNKKHFIITVND